MSKDSTTPQSRRHFVKKSLMVLSSLPLFDSAIGNTAAFAQVPAKPVDEKSLQAAALGYVADATKTDTAKFPKRKEAGGDKQFCSNCLFLTQTGLKADGVEGEWGKCALFPEGLVNTKGWCNSWAPKAA